MPNLVGSRPEQVPTNGALGRAAFMDPSQIATLAIPTETVASAATTDIASVGSPTVNVTGTTTITALGNAGAGAYRIVTFAGALTLTHNATSLILPSGDNILTVAGDSAEFLSLGSGNWKCTAYLPAVGQIATQAEAQAGTATNRVMTPLRVVQAIQSQQNPLLNYTLGFV